MQSYFSFCMLIKKKILSKSPKPIMATSKSRWAIGLRRLKIRQLLGGNSIHELLSPGLDSVTGEDDKYPVSYCA